MGDETAERLARARLEALEERRERLECQLAARLRESETGFTGRASR